MTTTTPAPAPTATRPSTSAAAEQLLTEGYHVARGLFSPDEVAALRGHAMDLVHHRSGEFCEGGAVDPDSADPLRRYPRIIQPHRKDLTSRRFLLAPRLRVLLTELLGEEPVAVQTMIYFKPPGGRGQALHQDQRYLQVAPGTCVAAWLALDDCDPDNGGMRVVPRSHLLDLLCPVPSDTDRSFTAETVPVPEGLAPVDVVMQAGDVLFFLGNVIHGSEPNTTQDRFRRVIVGHYATGDAQRISRWYEGAMSFDELPAPLEGVEGGGRCGEFVDGEFAFTSTVDAALGRH